MKLYTIQAIILTNDLFHIVKRNQRGDDKLYVGPNNQGFKLLKEIYNNKTDASTEVPLLVEGVQGTVLLADECVPIGE